MRKLLRGAAFLFVLGLLLAAAGGYWAHRWLDAPIAALNENRTFEVPRGASLRAVGSELARRQILDHPEVWIAWARVTRAAGRLKAGEYLLKPGMSPRQVLQLFKSGAVILHSVTFVEGTTFRDVRYTLATHAAVRQDYASRSDEEVMRALGSHELHPEGQFFPDTYHFPRGSSDLELLSMAHRRMQAALASVWKDRAPDLPLANSYEALILASIVEKETGLDSERAQIAGVFIERLRRGMRLQTDPTVIYGMLETYDGNIRRKDLLRDTPYNTYTRAGLPPTPIALPGLESLRAAVKPETTGALFFVATGEADGSHYFSKTLAEHNAAVQRYLRKMRQR